MQYKGFHVTMAKGVDSVSICITISWSQLIKIL